MSGHTCSGLKKRRMELSNLYKIYTKQGIHTPPLKRDSQIQRNKEVELTSQKRGFMSPWSGDSLIVPEIVNLPLWASFHVKWGVGVNGLCILLQLCKSQLMEYLGWWVWPTTWEFPPPKATSQPKCTLLCSSFPARDNWNWFSDVGQLGSGRIDFWIPSELALPSEC